MDDMVSVVRARRGNTTMPKPTHVPEPDHDTRTGHYCLTCRAAIVRVSLHRWVHEGDEHYAEMQRQNG
jgi:hypothetical protein